MKARRTQRVVTLRQGDKLLYGELLIEAIKGQNLRVYIEAPETEKYAVVRAPRLPVRQNGTR